MGKLFLFFITVFLISSASAQTVINIYVDSSGRALFLGTTDEDVVLPDGVNLNNGEISGFTTELTNKQGELWEFSYSLDDASLNVILPTSAVIKSASPSEISLNGNRISVFSEDNVTVSYELQEIIEPGFFTRTNIPILIVLIAIAFILVIYLVNFTNREKRNKPDKLETIKQVLNEREKLIVDKLRSTGKIKSSFLRKELGMPKASFSRHLQELEKKGLVKRSGEGKNKFIELI